MPVGDVHQQKQVLCQSLQGLAIENSSSQSLDRLPQRDRTGFKINLTSWRHTSDKISPKIQYISNKFLHYFQLFPPVAEATDSGLKCFVKVSVKRSGLEGPGCWL